MKKILALLLALSIVQCGLIFGQFFGEGGVHSSPQPSLKQTWRNLSFQA